jgi:hypothetical protein
MEDQMQVLSEALGLLIAEFGVRRRFLKQQTEQFPQSALIASSLEWAEKGACRLSGRGAEDRV